MTAIDLPEWVQPILDWVRAHHEFGAAICFLLGFGESLVLVSLFVPSTALFFGIGAVQSAAGGPFWPLWLAGAAGASIGDIVSYAIGRHFKEQVPNIWPFTKYPGLIPASREVFQKWGWLSIIGGKFLLGLRPFLPVAAGMMSMPWGTFVIASIVSSLIWAGVFLAPGFGVMLLFR